MRSKRRKRPAPRSTRPGDSFGPYLVAWRTAAGVSGREVARRAGISSAHYSNLESGRANPPTAPTCAKLADALELEPSAVLAAAGLVSEPVLRAFVADPEALEAAAAAILDGDTL